MSRFRLLTWNILADRWYIWQKDAGYGYGSAPRVEWPQRSGAPVRSAGAQNQPHMSKEQICAQLIASGADILCLQVR